MIELIQITNDPVFASRCDALDGMRLFVDLERLGKAERQAGRNTFISTHQVADVRRVKSRLRRSRLMVRVNPLNPGTQAEVEAVLDGGADMLMLPMFSDAATLQEFISLARGRVPVAALLETPGALVTLADWVGTPGLTEVYLGLNDLHLALGARFMFEPLANGIVEAVGAAAHAHKLGFGFGGIARLDEGLLPGRDVLAEHLRLGSGAVILSRTFHRADRGERFEQEVLALRSAEMELARRTPQQVRSDAARIRTGIERIAAGVGAD